MIAFTCDVIENCLYDQQSGELYLNQSQINGKWYIFVQEITFYIKRCWE